LETLTDEEIVAISTFRKTVALLCDAVVLLLVALPAAAQSQKFDVIAIKPVRSEDPRRMRMRVLPSGDLIASAANSDAGCRE